MPEDDRYSLTELADLAGVTPRTVRYYLAQGLLPAVGQSGPGNKYDAGHLMRLRLIRRLQVEHLPLAEIRRRIDGLSDSDIRDLSAAGEPSPPADSALDYLRTVLAVRPGEASMAVAGPPASPALQTRSLPRRNVLLSESLPTERSQWERIALAPDVELHIRRPLARVQQKQIDRLVSIARELLEEDRS